MGRIITVDSGEIVGKQMLAYGRFGVIANCGSDHVAGFLQVYAIAVAKPLDHRIPFLNLEFVQFVIVL